MTDTTLKLTEAGSSPLARGTQKELRQAITFPGLIPARAGNTDTTRRYLLGLRAHPRSRGEHRKPAMTKSTPPGSSPLARGTQSLRAFHIFGVGLIPARAGNTSPCPALPGLRRAHPRSRGEHDRIRSAAARCVGSSPLARGTPRQPRRRAPTMRLIPARAGNTPECFDCMMRDRAHPRSRGEHGILCAALGYLSGSSPLARGTLGRFGLLSHGSGLIPARAGNTYSHPRYVVARRAHPRSRGEHNEISYTRFFAWGSSPLARGTPVDYSGNKKFLGLIPARAGNTP